MEMNGALDSHGPNKAGVQRVNEIKERDDRGEDDDVDEDDSEDDGDEGKEESEQPKKGNKAWKKKKKYGKEFMFLKRACFSLCLEENDLGRKRTSERRYRL